MAQLFTDRLAKAAHQRAKFLRPVSEQKLELADPADAVHARALSDIRSLTELAGLDFSRGATGTGRALLNQVVDRITSLPSANWPMLRLALLGALVGRVRTTLAPTHILISIPGPSEMTRKYEWDWVEPRQAGALLAAALLSGQQGAELEPLLPDAELLRTARAFGEDDAAKPAAPALVALALCLETGVLPWFASAGVGLRRPDWARAAAYGVVRQMQGRWHLRLRLMLQHPERRDLMLLPESVVDWPLLAILMALRASGWQEPPGAHAAAWDGPPGPERFHAELAVELDSELRLR